MSTAPRQRQTREVIYPSGDGKPMAETELHLHDMIESIQVLEDRFATHRMCTYAATCCFITKRATLGNTSRPMCCWLTCPRTASRLLPGLEGGESPRLRHRDHVEVDQAGRQEQEVCDLPRHSEGVRALFVRSDRETICIRRSKDFGWSAGSIFRSSRLPAACRARSWVSISSVTEKSCGFSTLRPTSACRRGWRRANRPSVSPKTHIVSPKTHTARTEDEHRLAEDAHRRAEDEHRRADNAEAAQRRLVEENERLRRELEALRRQ